MKIDWEWVEERLKENSTWRGLIGLICSVMVLMGSTKTVEWLNDSKNQLAILGVGYGISSVINIVRKAPPTTPPKAS